MNNEALKEQRQIKMKEAEKKMQRLAGELLFDIAFFVSYLNLSFWIATCLWTRYDEKAKLLVGWGRSYKIFSFKTCVCILNFLWWNIWNLNIPKWFICLAALNVHSDDPLLHVYNSIQEKLEAITEQYNKAKLKVIFLFYSISCTHY